MLHEPLCKEEMGAADETAAPTGSRTIKGRMYERLLPGFLCLHLMYSLMGVIWVIVARLRCPCHEDWQGGDAEHDGIIQQQRYADASSREATVLLVTGVGMYAITVMAVVVSEMCGVMYGCVEDSSACFVAATCNRQKQKGQETHLDT